MDDAEINRAVAERLGWKEDWSDGTFWGWTHRPTSRFFVDSPPDFVTSLDAMAEAEATLTSEERFMYGAYIADGRECGVGHWDTLLFAPARTRALALLAATKNRVTATKEQTP